MKLILLMIKRHIVLFSISVLFLTAEAFCDLAQPALMAKIVDKGIKSGNINNVVNIGIVMFVVVIIGAVCAVIRNNISSYVSQKIGQELRFEVYKKIQNFSFQNIDKFSTASLITRSTNDITQVQNFINGSMRIFIKAPLIFIGAIFLILTQTPVEFPIILSILIVCIILIVLNMVLSYSRYKKLQKSIDNLNNSSREFLSSLRIVKIFSREDFEEEKFYSAALNLSQATISAVKISAFFFPLINLTINLGIIAFLLLGGISHTDNIGGLMASINYMTHILFSLGMISAILNIMARAIASSDRINEVLKEDNTIISVGNNLIPNKDNINLSFKNVNFAYTKNSKNVLENISFSCKNGETVGIIGSTGTGKTSLINLIPRFYDVSSGEILLSGINIKDLSIKELRGIIGIVPQKSILFSDSIKSNILWGNENATDEEIINATKIAKADDFINSFNEKYDTILGQGGVNLSGGQKQRISIARAVIKKPKIFSRRGDLFAPFF